MDYKPLLDTHLITYTLHQGRKEKSGCDEHEHLVWLETLLNKHINNNKIARVIEFDEKQVIPEGDNYVSIISQAVMSVILRNGQKSKISVIIKKSHEDENKRKVFEKFPLFKVETKVYKEVLQKCEVLMSEYQDYNEKLWCNLIGCRPYDMLVFEDLKLQNYRVADRTKMLDLQHSKLIMHSLGRLHALSYVLLQKGLLNKGDLAPFYCENDDAVVANLFRGGLKVLSKVIEKYWPPEWKEISERLRNERDHVIKKLNNLFVPQENNFITMCHGDCWTCNLMFKYSPCDENYPVAVKFIDFQVAHINSYIFDLVHFLYVSIHPEVRRSNYDQLLLVYHKSLQSTLTLYGFEDRTPTIEQIHSDAKRIEYYAFTACFIALPITTANVKGAFKMEHLEVGCNNVEAFNEDIFNSDLFRLAVQPELKKWFNEGLF